MKALSLLQPWASLIPFLFKGIETRSWKTSYRGPLAIHASAGFPSKCKKLCYQEPFYQALQRGLKLHPEGNEFDVSMLPLGKVIATCDLVDCVYISTDGEDLWENPFIKLVKERLTKVIDLGGGCKQVVYTPEFYFGDYTAGRYAWILKNVKALAEPVPAKGALSIWDWDAPAALTA